MDLQIKDRTYIVCGSTSGFGLSITKHLVENGAKVIAIARGEDKLRELSDAYKGMIEPFQGDITKFETIDLLYKNCEQKTISGILVNAGGPPAMKFVESKITDWDNAYNQVLRWKIYLTQKFLNRFIEQKFGRLVYIESSSVKQPLENLVLSTSMRLSVVGMMKTLAQELPNSGITFNVMAPGYHQTPAVDRILNKKAKDEGITKKQALKLLEGNLPMKKSGNVDNFGSLGAWLLSPLSEYVNGQVYPVDGGVIKGTL